MAIDDSAENDGGATGTVVRPRRKPSRYIVPVAVAGVAAATIGLVPALADTGDPELPEISAQELIEKIAASDQEQLSGTVKITTDLGIPSLGGIARSLGGGDSAQGAAPQERLMELASGTHTLRVAADGPDKQKVSVLKDASEYTVVHNADDVWAYDSASDEVYHAQGGASQESSDEHSGTAAAGTPKELAERVLAETDDTTSITVDGTKRVAGRDTYQLVVKPKQADSTIGSVRIAVDAEKGVPLKFTLSPSGGGKAAVDAGFTQVDFSAPAASTFRFTPPKGAEVTESDEAQARPGTGTSATEALPEELKGLGGKGGPRVIGEGWTAIAEIRNTGSAGAAGGAGGSGEAQQFLDALGDKVEGKFGSGTVFKTRLVNALITDKGTVYVGAVTQDALVKAADAAK